MTGKVIFSVPGRIAAKWRLNPSVARYLSLKFPTRRDYSIGQRLECREFVDLYYAFYRKTGVLDSQPAIQP